MTTDIGCPDDCYWCGLPAETVPWDVPATATPLADIRAVRLDRNVSTVAWDVPADADYWRARALNAEARAERAERLRRIWRDTTVSQKETASRLRIRVKGLEIAAGLTRFDLAVQQANAMLQADTIKKRTEERDQAVERAESAERMATVWQDIARRWEKASNGWKAQAQNWQGVAATLEGMRLTTRHLTKAPFPRMDFHGRSPEAGTES